MADQPSVWGAIIREIRESQGLSQRELCARTGICRNALRRLETGGDFFSIESLEKLLDFLGYDLDAIPRADFKPTELSKAVPEAEPKKLVDPTVSNVVRHHDPFETGDDI